LLSDHREQAGCLFYKTILLHNQLTPHHHHPAGENIFAWFFWSFSERKSLLLRFSYFLRNINLKIKFDLKVNIDKLMHSNIFY